MDFTTEELMMLKQLINLAVRAGGIQVAKPAVFLDDKLNAILTRRRMEQDDASAERTRRGEAGDAQVQARNVALREFNGSDRKGSPTSDSDRPE
jgi:hypothetical protein